MNIETSCCDHDKAHKHGAKFDWALHGSLLIIAVTLGLHYSGLDIPYVDHFAHKVLEMLAAMWWGIALGMALVGIMTKIPREYFTALLGRGDTYSGIVRAALAGVLLDMCSHGILMVGAKLYERGASIAQVMTFLIASPWNSISLTLILIGLIGLKWTIVFTAASVLVALLTGIAYKFIVENGWLPENPNKVDLPKDFSFTADVKKRLKTFKPDAKFFRDIVHSGWTEGQMLLRWLLVGVIIAAALNTFMPPDMFATWFGPTLIGLGTTLVAATIIEVCSEGSAPIASEILTRAAAPGNAFTFLMAGVSTDYTEMLILREATKSWKIALSLPLVTVPQIVLLGYIMNVAQ
jgi:uncharacterized protein